MSFNRFAGRLAVLCFLGCLVVGLIAVTWRAIWRADTLRAAARAEALSQMASVEAQLNQTLSAAQSLSLLARQSGGTVPNFARVAGDLLTVFPAVDCLQLEPNGVVSDFFPRAGHERLTNFIVTNDPAQKADAQRAIQQRALTVSGPLLLSGGELGIVARVPIFQRGRDNREAFWGFTAASTRLSQAIARARVADLARCGYNYMCYVPASGQQHALTVSAYGTVSAKDAVLQSLKIQGAEIRLALQTRGGWYDKARIGLELFGVLLVSGLVGLFINALESRQAVEQALAEANQQVARETTERQRNQEDLRSIKDSVPAAQARQRELDDARASLKQAQQTIADLQSKLQTAAQAEKDNAAAVLVRLQQDQAAIAEVNAHLEAATRSAREAAEASDVKIGELETANQKLTARFAAAAHYEARVAELTASVQQAEAEVERLRESLAAASKAPVEPEAVIAVEPVPTESAEPEKPKAERRRRSKPAEEPAPEPTPGAAPAEPAVVSETSVEYHAEPAPVMAAELKHNGEESHAAPSAENEPQVAVEVALTELAEVPSPGREPAELTAADTETPVREKAVKSAKRKKSRRADQMDLFGAADPAEENSHHPAVEAPVLDEPRPETASLFNLDEAPEKPPQEPRRGHRREPVSEPTVESAIAAPEMVAPEKAPEAPAAAEDEPPLPPAHDSKAQAKSLRRFVEEYSRAAEKIRDDLVQGDSAAALKTIEALREAADEVGTREVHSAASALARALRDQADPTAAEFLWVDLQKSLHDLTAGIKPAARPKSEKTKPSRPLPPAPPLDVAELRGAVGMIVPLLMDHDPGAKDCLKDNRDTFRSTFSPEGYVDFEEAVKGDDYGTALEHLRKATRKHGISV